jgi:hypothetical protein
VSTTGVGETLLQTALASRVVAAVEANVANANRIKGCLQPAVAAIDAYCAAEARTCGGAAHVPPSTGVGFIALLCVQTKTTKPSIKSDVDEDAGNDVALLCAQTNVPPPVMKVTNGESGIDANGIDESGIGESGIDANGIDESGIDANTTPAMQSDGTGCWYEDADEGRSLLYAHTAPTMALAMGSISNADGGGDDHDVSCCAAAVVARSSATATRNVHAMISRREDRRTCSGILAATSPRIDYT